MTRSAPEWVFVSSYPSAPQPRDNALAINKRFPATQGNERDFPERLTFSIRKAGGGDLDLGLEFRPREARDNHEGRGEGVAADIALRTRP